jgi:hypothetical protein
MQCEYHGDEGYFTQGNLGRAYPTVVFEMRVTDLYTPHHTHPLVPLWARVDFRVPGSGILCCVVVVILSGCC